jgi:hypothetical protein
VAPANVNPVLPINFCAGLDEIVTQLKEAREQICCGGVDLPFQTPGSEQTWTPPGPRDGDAQSLPRALTLSPEPA